MKKHIANIITCTRIIGTICLMFLEPSENYFYYVYTYCGISDVLDGLAARSLKIASSLGSTLDSISDLLFYSVMMIKMLPTLNEILPEYIWYFVYAILLIRLFCYAFVYFRMHKLSSRHTIYNKITGLLVFFIPFMIKTPYMFYYSVVIIAIALFAVSEEIYYIRKRIKNHERVYQ